MHDQVFLNGLLAGSIYALVALGFAIIYSTVRFFHFAHGAVYTAGAYFAYLFFVILQWPFALAVPLAILLTALFGVGIEFSIYRPIQRRGAGSLVLLIASLGGFIIIQNLISLFFGDDTKSVRFGVVKEGIEFFSARITPIQIATLISAIVLVVITWLILKYSIFGKASRAVANDPNLSEVYGINKEKIYNFVFVYGSALAAIAGILSALDTDMTPTMGFPPLMMGVIAMIIGGVGSIPGIVLGSLLLGFAQNFAAWYLPSQWQDAIAFAIMLIFLLFRPQGFFGKPLQKAAI